MKIAAIICTVNRPSVLHDTVLSITRQSVVPAQILIASPESRHVLSETLAIPGIEFVLAPIGASKQRNAGLGRIVQDIDLVAFLDDDDVWPADKLEWQVEALRSNPRDQVIGGSCDLLMAGGKVERTLP